MAGDFSTVSQCECKWNTSKLLPVYCVEIHCQSVNVGVMSENTNNHSGNTVFQCNPLMPYHGVF